MGLRRQLRAHLARDWREDLVPVWCEFFAGDQPTPNVLETLNDDHVADPPAPFPARLQLGRPRRADEVVPAAKHMTRAFDRLCHCTQIYQNKVRNYLAKSMSLCTLNFRTVPLIAILHP